jgi:plasmid maintenance system antidote protein VapI
MTKLKTYLIQEKIPQTAFADTLGISQPSLNAILNGKTKVSVTLAVKIRDLTNGEVNVLSWA